MFLHGLSFANNNDSNAPIVVTVEISTAGTFNKTELG